MARRGGKQTAAQRQRLNKARWAQATGWEPTRRQDDWGLHESEGTPPTLIAADDCETATRFHQRIEEAIENAYETQVHCRNCGDTGTVWITEIDETENPWGLASLHSYTCVLCNPESLK
jgi:hypothetical protein